MTGNLLTDNADDEDRYAGQGEPLRMDVQYISDAVFNWSYCQHSLKRKVLCILTNLSDMVSYLVPSISFYWSQRGICDMYCIGRNFRFGPIRTRPGQSREVGF